MSCHSLDRRTYLIQLIVHSRDLEIALWMIAGGAFLWSILAYHNMSTVATLPDAVVFAREDNALFYIAHQWIVAFLVMPLNSSHMTKLVRYLHKAFFFRLLSHAVIHVCPLIVLTLSS